MSSSPKGLYQPAFQEHSSCVSPVVQKRRELHWSGRARRDLKFTNRTFAGSKCVLRGLYKGGRCNLRFEVSYRWSASKNIGASWSTNTGISNLVKLREISGSRKVRFRSEGDLGSSRCRDLAIETRESQLATSGVAFRSRLFIGRSSRPRQILRAGFLASHSRWPRLCLMTRC